MTKQDDSKNHVRKKPTLVDQHAPANSFGFTLAISLTLVAVILVGVFTLGNDEETPNSSLVIIIGSVALVITIPFVVITFRNWRFYEGNAVYGVGVVVKHYAEHKDQGEYPALSTYFSVVEYHDGESLIHLSGRMRAADYEISEVGSDVGVRFVPGQPAATQVKWAEKYRNSGG